MWVCAVRVGSLQLLSTDALDHFASLVGRHVVRPACALLRDACGRADGRRASHIARALVRGVRDLLPPTVTTDGALYGDLVTGASAGGVRRESGTGSGATAINGGALPREVTMPKGSREAVEGETVATDAVCVELALDAARRTVQLLAEGDAAGKREAVGALTALWGVHATFREELVTAGLTRALVDLLVEPSSGTSATSEGKAGRSGGGGKETLAAARAEAATLLWAMSTESDGACEELHRRGVPVALARQLAGIRPVVARVDAVGCLWSLAMIPGVAADVVAVGGAPPLVEVSLTPAARPQADSVDTFFWPQRFFCFLNCCPSPHRSVRLAVRL